MYNCFMYNCCFNKQFIPLKQNVHTFITYEKQFFSFFF